MRENIIVRRDVRYWEDLNTYVTNIAENWRMGQNETENKSTKWIGGNRWK